MHKRNGVTVSPSAYPDTQPKAAPALKCNRSCCWTPFGHKVDAKNCKCHVVKESLYK